MHPSRTRKPPYDTAAAVAHLTTADPKLARLIARAGPFTMRIAGTQSPFEALVEAIVYQQLHGKAAATIHRRLLESFLEPTEHHLRPDSRPPKEIVILSGAKDPLLKPPSPLPHPAPALLAHPTPQHLLDCPNSQLRAAGLSGNKALAIRDLAAKTLDGTVPTLARIRRMSDEAIVTHLTQVRGVGKWTVEMLLIFRLGRPDVLPTSDYGVRKGFALTFQGLKPTTKVTPALLPTAAEMERRARKWHPWCSVASWYLWRACDLAAGKKLP